MTIGTLVIILSTHHHFHLVRGKSVTNIRGPSHLSSLSLYPTTNGGMQSGSSVGTCARRVHVFCTFFLHQFVRSVGAASELSQKLIKRCVVGWVLPLNFPLTLSPPSLSPPPLVPTSRQDLPGLQRLLHRERPLWEQRGRLRLPQPVHAGLQVRDRQLQGEPVRHL